MFNLQLGFSSSIALKIKADKLTQADYAAGKVLAGLKRARPAFYRGLDSDGIDAYREFREMQDVTKTADFLTELEG